MKKTTIIHLLLFIFLPLIVWCQSINYRAQGHYYSAKEAYQANNYSAALDYIYKCKQALGGINNQVQYLHVLAAYHNGSYAEAQKEMNVFFDLEEGKIKPVRFDKSVEPLTTDEIKAITKLINAIDESVIEEAQKEKRLAEERKAEEALRKEEQLAAERRAEENKAAAWRRANNITGFKTGDLYLGMPLSEFQSLVKGRIKEFNATDPDILEYLQTFQFKSYGPADKYVFYGIDSDNSNRNWFPRASEDLPPKKKQKLEEKLWPLWSRLEPKLSENGKDVLVGFSSYTGADARYFSWTFDAEKRLSEIYIVLDVSVGGLAETKDFFSRIVYKFGEPDEIDKQYSVEVPSKETQRTISYKDPNGKTILKCKVQRSLIYKESTSRWVYQTDNLVHFWFSKP